MQIKKRKSFKKPVGYAVLSTAALVGLASVPAVVAHADVNFSGNTNLKGEVVITKQVELLDATANGSLKDAKIIINPASNNPVISLGNIAANDIEIKGSVALKGNKLENATIFLNPVAQNSKVDLSGTNATKITIENNNVTEISVPENVTTITLAEGVSGESLKVTDKTGKEKEVTFEPVETPKENFNLSIMHTNDTHASLDNVAKRVTAVKEVRDEKPNALLLDAGDVMSGTLYFNEFQGMADLEFMNLMKYDAMTFGNHEFDLGSSAEGLQALKDFVEAAKFPFVSANVDFSKDDKFTGLFSDVISSKPEEGKIYQGIIKEIDGEKVGIFGLTTAETASLSSPGKVTFEDYKAEAEKAVKAFEGQGVDKIIAITHIGFDDNAAIDNDLTLAAEVEGIDVIVGGHSHTTLSKPTVVDAEGTPTLIVQTGNANSNLGVLDVEFDKQGKIIGHAGKLIAIGSQAADPEAAAILAKYKQKVDATALTEIGVEAKVALTNPRTGDTGNTTGESVRKNETILGNLITDGMLKKAKEVSGKEVIMALQNGGGIRAAIDAGPITVGEVITVLPFANTLATMDVTGAELKAAFEISLKSLPGENGGFLHVAGAEVKYDSTKPAGQRVVSIKYKNANGQLTALEDTKTYTIATNAFTAKGGDGFDVFATAYAEGRVTDLGLSDWENFKELLVSLTAIPTEIEGRIIDVNGEPEQPETEIPGGEIAGKDFSGTENAPKVYSGDVTVSVTDVASFKHVVVKGDLVLTGTLTENASFENIKVEGNLDLSGLDTDVYNLSGIEVTGETTI
ncbi:bifunctional metallophosphatase/5'-nucleotidase [Psychrobacillus sp. NPDC093180]|uniref:bifunctional metallophosphatase/5'-nucleotidase n=1 Tax=Psychrobacillus sp. NPDC093180 TaxID=3364489 RepID=UPI003818DAC7